MTFGSFFFAPRAQACSPIAKEQYLTPHFHVQHKPRRSGRPQSPQPGLQSSSRQKKKEATAHNTQQPSQRWRSGKPAWRYNLYIKKQRAHTAMSKESIDVTTNPEITAEPRQLEIYSLIVFGHNLSSRASHCLTHWI